VTYNIIVVGASGLVGHALWSEFSPHHKTVGTFCSNGTPNLVHLDIRDRTEIRSILLRVRPDVVLCPAAEPSVERCELDPVGTREINVNGLRNLITAVEELGAAFVYFSTDYVFDGLNGPYCEDSPCNPLNEYGRQKLECEQMIAAQVQRYLIARVSGVYGWEERKKNFVARMIDCLRSGKSFKVPSDQLITPTYGPNMARAVRQLVEKRHWGLFHLAGSRILLRTEFANIIATVFDLNASLIIPTATSDLELHASRPLFTGLKVDKAQTLLDFSIHGPLEGLEMMRRSDGVNSQSAS
jgi:dTDP-4-dehydrorhamnose reductase